MKPQVLSDPAPRHASWNVSTIRQVIEEHFAARPWLDDGPDVRVSTDVEAFESDMARLYETAYRRGDWFASEFSAFGELQLASGIFEQDSRSPANQWILFCDASNRLLGATKLVIDPQLGVLIDETQLDPVLGRGKGIMARYFMRISALLQGLQLPVRTEFVLTTGSRSLRETLIGACGMVPTGLRPGCYASPTAALPHSVLVAYGPSKEVQAAVAQTMSEASSVFQGLLDVIGRGQSPASTQAFALADPVERYEEAIVKTSDYELARKLRQRGFAPVSFDPFACTFAMARVPSDRRVYDQIDFLEKESSKVAIELARYVRTLASAANHPVREAA